VDRKRPPWRTLAAPSGPLKAISTHRGNMVKLNQNGRRRARTAHPEFTRSNEQASLDGPGAAPRGRPRRRKTDCRTRLGFTTMSNGCYSS